MNLNGVERMRCPNCSSDKIVNATVKGLKCLNCDYYFD